MKQFFKFLSLMFLTILMSGCENNELQVTKCTSINNNLSAKYSLKSEYIIYTKKDIVSKVEVKETVISDSSVILDYFETYFTNLYKTSNESYGGYTNKIAKENDELTSTTTINYEIVDIEKYGKDNATIKNYLNDKNEFTLEGIKTLYTTLGATCE